MSRSPQDGEARIVDAWRRNADPWTTAVREERIESRREVTDAAVIEAVLAGAPRSVLDLGCGEGWLARALSARGVEVVGVDVVPALIERARAAGGGDFRVCAYEDLAAGRLDLRVDVAVCNFSLLGQQSVDGLLAAVPQWLHPGGALVVQTLHPPTACGEAPYVDGWREGSWAGIPGAFADAAPWYFRTLDSWQALLARSGFAAVETRVPRHPATGQPASALFVARLA